MNTQISRSILFAVYVYIAMSIVRLITMGIFGVLLNVPFIITLLIEIVGSLAAIFMCAKWYFRTSSLPTAKEGLRLGLITVGVMFGLSLLLLLSMGSFNIGDGSIVMVLLLSAPLVQFTNPITLVTVVTVLFGTTYAGYEFDATYTGTPTDMS